MGSYCNNKSLCQTCFNFDCIWHNYFKPVEGWSATPTMLTHSGQTIASYQVKKCPQYTARSPQMDEIVESQSIAEIAEFICVNPTTLYRWIRIGAVDEKLKQYGISIKVIPENERYDNTKYMVIKRGKKK